MKKKHTNIRISKSDWRWFKKICSKLQMKHPGVFQLLRKAYEETNG